MTGAVLLAEVTLELTAPAAVSAPEQQSSTTATVRDVSRDGWGRPWIPPSSLAGSLRAHLGPQRGPALMGEETDGDNHDSGRPSAVRFLGTELTKSPPPDCSDSDDLLSRSRTAIDPRRGAAAEGLLHHHKHLPPGARVTCRLRVDDSSHHEEVLRALLTWRPIIGQGRTTGHGTTRTLAVRSTVVDLSTPEGRRLWLTTGGPSLFAAAGLREHGLPQHSEPDSFLPTLGWRIVDALHVGSGEHRAGESARILRDHCGRPCVPGTSWKGLLRSRSAYVLRSLDHDVCLETACGECPICETFGWTGTDAKGARGLLRFPDTPVATTTDSQVTERQHVGINRFTGGAADSLLFSEEVVEHGELTLHIHTYGSVSPLARAAIILALCDLDDGIIGIGGGTTRGNGSLACTTPDTLNALRTDAQRALSP